MRNFLTITRRTFMSKAPLVGGVTLGVLQRGVNGILMEKCRISGKFWNFLARIGVVAVEKDKSARDAD